MATDPRGLPRRQLLAGALLWAAGVSVHAATGGTRIAASWQHADGTARLGILELTHGTPRVVAQLELPSRAHQVAFLPGGLVLAVARRPGDWLLRWNWRSGEATWTWSEPDQVFTGHAVHDRERGRIYTGETRLDRGDGVVGVRDARSLELVAQWATLGRDPHELALYQGQLLVANGGIETRPETGRAKLSLDRMDSSLVLLDSGGQVSGQWRLDDRRLSLRHLAVMRTGTGMRVGIAMQAEHADPVARRRAPLLAVFDGRTLCACEGSGDLAGYAGDIAAVGARFVISATRGDCVVSFDADGTRLDRWPLAGAGALAASHTLYAAGAGQVLLGPSGQASPFRFDNHWAIDP